uniref:ACT domain-containing protein n=1 Tax=Fervidicoccus fontis TaxID=683846 RepID=A0A7J3ZLW6_9CREN
MVDREALFTIERWWFPVESPALVFEEESETLCGIEVIGVSRQGFLHDIVEAFDRKGYFIRHLAHSQRLHNEVAVFIVVDLVRSRPEVEIDQLLRELRRVPGVVSVTLSDKCGRMVCARTLFPLKVAGSRGVVLEWVSIHGIYESLREVAGPIAAVIIMVRAGLVVGSQVYRYHQGKFDFKTVEDAVWFLNAYLQSAGWGRILNYIPCGEKILLQIADLLDLDLPAEGGRRATDLVFLRGFLKGFFSEHLKREVGVRVLQVERVGSSTVATFEVDMQG